MKVYIAAPFFNPQQVQLVEDIKDILDSLDVQYFSPKDQCMFEKGVTKPKDILDLNVIHLLDCDTVIAVTGDKDMGTLFECGYAHAAKKDIIYFWDNQDPKLKFNLMLSASGFCVARSKADLENAIGILLLDGDPIDYEGELE